MGNSVEGVRFRGLVQLLAEKQLVEEAEIDVVDREFWTLPLESSQEFYSKFSIADARAITRFGNGRLLINESVKRLSGSKTACWTLSRLVPVHFADKVELPNPELIAHAVFSVLFKPEVCFYSDNESVHLWASFDGEQASGEGEDGSLDGNRTEILRLLVVLLSEPLFSPGSARGEVLTGIDFHQYEIQLHNLISSFFACIVNEHGRERASIFPSIFSAALSREELVTHCVNVATILLDMGTYVEEGEEDCADQKLKVVPQLFYKMEAYHGLIFHALVQRAKQEMGRRASTFVLLFRITDMCLHIAPDKFMESSADIDLCILVVLVLRNLWIYRSERARSGLVQMSSIILLSLSSHRKCGTALNCPTQQLNSELKAILPKDFPQLTGTLHDVVVVAVAKFVLEGDAFLFGPLQRIALTSLTNLSFYMQELGFAACIKLLDLMERFSRASLFFSSETSPQCVSSILEALTNILQYQSQGNSKLVYCIIRSKHVFTELVSRTFHESAVIPQTNNEGDFIPTVEWFNEWKAKVPIATCLYAIEEVEKRMSHQFQSNMDAIDEDKLLKLIEKTTLVGALPAPRPISMSMYMRNERIDSIIRRCFWLDLLQSEEYVDLLCIPLSTA